jgi:hypothetical protein
MKTRIILTLALGIFLFSCEEVAEHAPNGDAHPHTSHSDAYSSHEHQGEVIEEAGLSLNNGEKWKVNDSMMIHVRAGEKAVHSFGTTAVKDYQALAGNLKENINLLTSSCTMTGKAHDELHVWLLPYIALVDELSANADTEEAAKYFHKVEASFKTFNNYFE